MHSAAKALDTIQREKYSGKSADKSTEEKKGEELDEIKAHPMQKGFGDIPTITEEDGSLKTPLLDQTPKEQDGVLRTPVLDQTVQQNDLATPIVESVTPSTSTSTDQQTAKVRPAHEENDMVERFVRQIKERSRFRARHILLTLLKHKSEVTWDKSGDVSIKDNYIGNLHILLPKLFYGSRRVPSMGETEWFALIKKLGLDPKVSNKSKPIRYSRRKKSDTAAAEDEWYKIRM